MASRWSDLNIKMVKNAQEIHHKHARQKRRCANDPCLFELFLFWMKKVHLWCLLKHKMKAKRSNQSKVPSINKHCFLFPLSSFFATAELYLLGCLFSIAKQKGLRGSIAFAWCATTYPLAQYHVLPPPKLLTLWAWITSKLIAGVYANLWRPIL